MGHVSKEHFNGLEVRKGPVTPVTKGSSTELKKSVSGGEASLEGLAGASGQGLAHWPKDAGLYPQSNSNACRCHETLFHPRALSTRL